MLYLRPYWINNFSFELCELLLRIYQFFKSLVALPVIEICRRSSITAHLYVLFWWASYRSLPILWHWQPLWYQSSHHSLICCLTSFLQVPHKFLSLIAISYIQLTVGFAMFRTWITHTHTHTHTHTNVYSACWYPSCQLMMVMVAMWKRLLFYRATKFFSNGGWVFYFFIYLFCIHLRVF